MNADLTHRTYFVDHDGLHCAAEPADPDADAFLQMVRVAATGNRCRGRELRVREPPVAVARTLGRAEEAYVNLDAVSGRTQA